MEEIKIRKTSLFRFFPEPFQGILRFFQPAQAFYQIRKLIDLKHRFPVYPIIIGLSEILCDHSAAGIFEFLPVYGPLPDQTVLLPGSLISQV